MFVAVYTSFTLIVFLDVFKETETLSQPPHQFHHADDDGVADEEEYNHDNVSANIHRHLEYRVPRTCHRQCRRCGVYFKCCCITFGLLSRAEVYKERVCR